MVKASPKSAARKAPPKSRAYSSADTSLRISAAEFVAWQDALGLSNEAAARALYRSPNTIAAYRVDGAPADIAILCRAIRLGVAADDSWQFIEKAAETFKTLRAFSH
jgi:hypothetical protein